MKRIKVIIPILISLFSLNVNAAHLIGGKFRATYINDYQIKIQLEIERDCISGGAPFENSIFVGLYKKSNDEQVATLVMPRDTIISSSYNYDCNGLKRCVQVGYFSTIFNINIINNIEANGYYLHWERCCLNNLFINLFDPGATPYSAVLELTKFRDSAADSTVIRNSTPYRNEIFNPLICLNKDFETDLSFIDDDGDSLVYEISEPIAGGYTSLFNPAQRTGPKPYDLATWSLGFDIFNILPNKSNFSFNTSTGILKFKPIALGLYILPISIHEYRNGIKIGTVNYETNLFIYKCDSAIIIHPKNQNAKVDSSVIFRTKHMLPFVSYQWQLKKPTDTLFYNILNANSDSLVINNIKDSMNNNEYRCLIQKTNCTDITNPAVLYVNTTDINNIKTSKKITLSPNPSNTIVTISGVNEPNKVSLYSLDGKLLKEINHSNTIDLSDILPGMYIVQVTDKNHNANYFGKLRVGE